MISSEKKLLKLLNEIDELECHIANIQEFIKWAYPPKFKRIKIEAVKSSWIFSNPCSNDLEFDLVGEETKIVLKLLLRVYKQKLAEKRQELKEAK